jgi:hypothetical protein
MLVPNSGSLNGFGGFLQVWIKVCLRATPEGAPIFGTKIAEETKKTVISHAGSKFRNTLARTLLMKIAAFCTQLFQEIVEVCFAHHEKWINII